MDCVNHPGVDAPYNCYRCRAPICVECESKLDRLSICRSCLAYFREQIALRYEAEQRQINYCRAFLAAVGTAVAVAVAWSQVVMWTPQHYPWHFVAALLGGAVGFATRMGAGEKRGRALQQLAAMATLFGVILGHYCIFYRTQFTGRFATVSSEPPLMLFPNYLTELSGLDWVFLVVGVLWSYWVPRVRHLPD